MVKEKNNKKLVLESVSKEEIDSALNEYINKDTKEEKYIVIKKVKKVMPWIFPLITSVGLLFTGFGKKTSVKQTTDIEKQNNLQYELISEKNIDIYETEEQLLKRTLSKYETGNKVFIPYGTNYYRSSDYKYYPPGRRKGTVGITYNRPEGEYNLDYFSIISKGDGRILYVERNPGKDLYSVVNETIKNHNKTIDEIEAIIHIGGPRSGWVDISDLLLYEKVEPQITENKIVLDEEFTYTGSIENFTGDTITINNGEKNIEIKIKDENGMFIKEGITIIGNDGEKYQFKNFDVKEKEIINNEKIINTDIKWKIENINDKEQLMLVAVGITELFLSLKKKREYIEMTDSEIQSKIRFELEYLKSRYSDLEIKKTVEKTTHKKVENSICKHLKDSLIEKNITIEQTENLMKLIRKK